MPASLRALQRRENAARISLQPQRSDLRAISFRIDAKAARSRQPRLAQTREIRRLGTKAAGVRGFRSCEREYKLMHDSC